MNRKVFVDASERFAVRRELAALESGSSETRIALDCMRQQPGQFIDFLSQYNKDVSGALDLVRGEGFEVRIAGEEVDITSDQERVLPSSEYGVFYIKGKDRPLQPTLYIGQSTIINQFHRFGPIFAEADGPEIQKHQLGATVAASCWMALGKWTVDTIDPRNVEDPETSLASLKALSSFTGISPEVVMSDDNAERIEDIMSLIAYRMAGGMAYAGLATYLKNNKHEDNDLPHSGSISVLQYTMRNMFELQRVENPESIHPTVFALAYPLSRKDVIEVLDNLGPVAKELQDQDGLPALF
ncbi:MAG: hypothetical protein M3Q14_00120 [bacterium]|nr:hypothetical protein [bacterium]